MSSRKQQRDYARRRYEKWLARQEELRARQRRRRTVAGWALGAVGLVLAVWLVVDLVTDDDPAADDAAVITETPSVEPSTDPVDEPSEAPEPEIDPPDPALAEGRTWTATLDMTIGDVTVELDGAAAPQAVAAFLTLARDGFYTGTSCDRLTTSGFYLLECGGTAADGTGPDFRFGPIENAPADDVYPAGTVAMDREAGDGSSMGGRFFIVYEDSTILPDSAGGYTVVGRITQGLDALRMMASVGVASGTADTPATDVTIEGVEIQ